MFGVAEGQLGWATAQVLNAAWQNVACQKQLRGSREAGLAWPAECSQPDSLLQRSLSEHSQNATCRNAAEACQWLRSWDNGPG